MGVQFTPAISPEEGAMPELTHVRQGIKGHSIVLAVDVGKRGHWS